MSDTLRAWLKSNGVWQLDLCKMMAKMDIDTLSDFQSISKSEVIDLINEAKKTGFMHAKKLKALHPSFPTKKKKTKISTNNNSQESKEKPKTKEELKYNARPILEKWLRKENLWQIDLFDLMTDRYDIYTPEDFYALKEDEDMIEEFFKDAKQAGVMAHKQKILGVLCGLRKSSANKKKKQIIRSPKTKTKTKEELKYEARSVLEKWLRKENLWQIDLFDLMTDKYDIYTPQDFYDIKEDEDMIEEFFKDAKHAGVMGQKQKILGVLCGLRKSSTKKKKQKIDNVRSPKNKTKEELKYEARSVLEKWLRKENLWQIDLFDLMTDKYEIYTPEDFYDLKEDEDMIEEFFMDAKQAGVMAKKQKILGVLCGLRKFKPKKTKKIHVNNNRRAVKEPTKEEIEMQARDVMEPFMRENGFWNKDLFLVLIDFDVCKPNELQNLSKGDVKNVLKRAKTKGLMGGTAKTFKNFMS